MATGFDTLNRLIFKEIDSNDAPLPHADEEAIYIEGGRLKKMNSEGVESAFGETGPLDFYPEAVFQMSNTGDLNMKRTGSRLDFGLSPSVASRLSNIEFGNTNSFIDADDLTVIAGGKWLASLEDVGTGQALILGQCNGVSAEGMNAFFEDLPVTTKSATVKISNYVLKAEVDKDILTNKGYSVLE